MAEVIGKRVAVVQPPEEFAITGLTRYELLAIHALIGGTIGMCGGQLYSQIGKALRLNQAPEYEGALFLERQKVFPDLKGEGKF